MITIKIPNNHIPEREYILYVLFEERLNIKYKIVYGEDTETVLVFPNQKEIIIEDHFFSKFSDENRYLSKENIPDNYSILNNGEIKLEHLPIFYGLAELNIEAKEIRLKSDIIAMIFFLLSRWEENVLTNRDSLNRVIEEDLFVVKNNLQERPLVDEYVNLIAILIKKSGYEKFSLDKNYTIIPTHDVDFVKKWRNTFHAWKEIGGDAIKRRNLSRAIYNLVLWSSSKLRIINEPNNTIEILINKAKTYNRKAVFFFMSGGSTCWDSYSDKDTDIIADWANKIIDSKNSLGIHPSILTAQSADLTAIELKNYQNIVKYQICCSRQHYLRLLIPETWKILEKNNIGWDSSCGFSNHIGFRCGTAIPFRVFDIETRMILRLKEKPLIVMDTALVEHAKFTENEAIERISKIKSRIEQFGGEFIFLLHNSSLRSYEYQKYKRLIEELYK